MIKYFDKTNDESQLNALYDALKQRFGVKIALEIIDAVENTRVCKTAPSYMIVKACSEMLELFRGEAQDQLRALRGYKSTRSALPENITSIEEKKLEADFRCIFRLYWVSMKLFYGFYTEALEAARIPQYLPSTFTGPTPFARAA